jgi:uncharacterized protein
MEEVMSTTTTWVIKLSKLCNMRCSYCYEWNELANPARMSLEVWERVVRATLEHGASVESRFAEAKRAVKHRNLIVFHGGEPLALPTAYLKRVLELFDELSSPARGSYQLSVQSNLFSINEEKIALLRDRNAQISVSFDLVPGVRLNVAGKPTEAVVSRNIDTLRAQGIKLGAIAVLAKHTVDQVTRIYDFFAERQMAMRILPLFDGPAERELPSFWLDHGSMRRGLRELFRHWIETGCAIPVYPLVGYFEAALRHMAGLYRPIWTRERYGDSVFLINVDGKAYRVLDAYEEELALGDLASQNISELLESESYRRSLERDRTEFEQHCHKCKYLGACSSAYLYSSRVSDEYEGLCPSAHSCISFMIDYVRERGYGRDEIRGILEQMRQRSAAAAAPG